MPQHQKQAAARGSSKAEFCACCAIPGGATNVLCRSIWSGATKGTCHTTKSKMQSLLGLGTQWRDKVGLSRQWCWRDRSLLPRHSEWRDQRDLPRHQVKNAVPTGLGHTMARQSRLVAPVVLARQIPSAAPLCAQA